jgi:hypothetical protein
VQKIVDGLKLDPVGKIVEVPQPYPVQKIVEKVGGHLGPPHIPEEQIEKKEGGHLGPPNIHYKPHVEKVVDQLVPQSDEVRVPQPYEFNAQICYRDVPIPEEQKFVQDPATGENHDPNAGLWPAQQ